MHPTTGAQASIHGTALTTAPIMIHGEAPGPTLIISPAGRVLSAITGVTPGIMAGTWVLEIAGAATAITTHGILITDMLLTGTLPTITTGDGAAVMATILAG